MIYDFIFQELGFAVLIFYISGLRFLMRHSQKRGMILLWDLVILRLLLPIRFTLRVRKEIPIFRYLAVHKEKTFYQNINLSWIETELKKISLILVVCYLGIAFYSYFKLFFRKKLCSLEWVKEWEKEKKISVFESPDVHSACVCGIWKPIILCSSLLKEEKSAFLILEHERCHIFRHDIVRRHVIQILTCFHWYNPAFWILRKQVLDDMEMACDEAVTEQYGDSIRVEYARLLLSTTEIKYTKNRTYFNKNIVKERVRCMLMTDRKKRHLTVFGVFAVLAAMGVSCLRLAAYERRESFPGNQIVYETEWRDEEGNRYHYAEIIAYLEFVENGSEEEDSAEEVEETQNWNEGNLEKENGLSE